VSLVKQEVKSYRKIASASKEVIQAGTFGGENKNKKVCSGAGKPALLLTLKTPAVQGNGFLSQ